MKHIFIVNPMSGQGDESKKLIGELEKRKLDCYVTKGPGDGANHIRQTCERSPSEPIRFYSCGGDGTFNEVVNGAFGFTNAEVAVMPAGSGNDFIKNFAVPLGHFKDIDKQLSGSAVTIDLIRYQDTAEGSEAKYAANMFNIGFDCNVVVKMAAVKKYPFVRGSLAYLLSILLTLIKKDGADLIIDFEDGTSHRGYVFLTAIGNGAFCGGGLKGMPRANLKDGLMDICIVQNVSRRMVIPLLPKYANGTHLEDQKLKDYILYKQCKSFTIRGFEDRWNLCVDGDVKTVGKTRFDIVPDAIKFSLPGL